MFDEAIRDIIWNCRCIPKFYDVVEKTREMESLHFCTGKNLYCANNRIKHIADKNIEELFENRTEEITVEEARQNPNYIGNISRPAGIKCLPSCYEQKNNNQMSSAPYPTRSIFVHQKFFCDIASHILQGTVELRNSGMFGHPDFFRYCGVFRYLAGYLPHPKNHTMKIFFQYTRLCIFLH